nr:phospholipase-like protein [Tanacetum cinerariifolium]
HIDWWVDYMQHGRPDNANKAMVNCYSVQILLQNSTPLFYANDDKYATPWSDVDQDYELEKCKELMKSISETQLKVLKKISFIDKLHRDKVFDKKGIDPTDYCIRFKLAENAPKQGEMQAMNDPEEFYDALFCLRGDKRVEYNTLVAINDVIAKAEEKLTTKEAHLEIIEAEINLV